MYTVRMMRTLRSRLLLLNITVTAATLVILFGVSYSSFRNFQRRSVRQAVHTNMKITMDSIDRNMGLVRNMLDWFTLSDEVLAFMSASERYPNDMKFKSMTAYNNVRNVIYSNGLSGFVDKLLVGDLRGHSIQFGIAAGHFSDYARSLNLPDTANPSLIPEPFFYSEEELVFPMRRRVMAIDESQSLGFIALTVNSSIITRYTRLSGIQSPMGICIGSGVYAISPDGSLSEMGELDCRVIEASLESPGDKYSGIFPNIPTVTGADGREWVVYRGEDSGWILLQQVPVNHQSWQGVIFIRLLFFVALVMVISVLIITLILDHTVNDPIHRIRERIGKIAAGDFSNDPSIDFKSEIGYIGKGINQMVTRIDQLITARVDQEKTKKDLEFRILQSQINPHFLYNTLNSIKWMAKIQKATGIEEMVSSLAVLLRELSKGTAQMIPLKKELELVAEYCRIQDYRTAGMVQVEYSPSDLPLNRILIIPFTLQPIVENAIFHGIEPKQEPGRITITPVESEPGIITVEIRDNGVGISPETLPYIMKQETHSAKSLNHIGLKNVDDRFKMQYGDSFGIRVESRVGEYTAVYLRFPRIDAGEGDTDNV